VAHSPFDDVRRLRRSLSAEEVTTDGGPRQVRALHTVVWGLDLGSLDMHLETPERLEQYREVLERPHPAFWSHEGAHGVGTFLCRSFVTLKGERHLLPYNDDGYFELPPYPPTEPLEAGAERIKRERGYFLKPKWHRENVETVVAAANRLRRANVRVVFVSAPLTSSFRQAVTSEEQAAFDRDRESLLAATGATYRSFVDALPDDPTLFSNPDHLQAAGAVAFTQLLSSVAAQTETASPPPPASAHDSPRAHLTWATIGGHLFCGEGSPETAHVIKRAVSHGRRP
jgi:hypothetical protein